MTIQEKLKFVHENPAISWHEHVQQCGEDGKELNIAHADHQMEVAEMLGIDRMVVSIPLPGDKHCPPEDFRIANDVVALATKRYPDKVFVYRIDTQNCGNRAEFASTANCAQFRELF